MMNILTTDPIEMENLTVDVDAGDVSDGYHTFNELYDHRHRLFVNLVLAHKDIAFKTRKNREGESWEGWFILGMNTIHGQISYHLPEIYWHIATVQELASNADYDDHSADDVLIRLVLFAQKPYEQPKG